MVAALCKTNSFRKLVVEHRIVLPKLYKKKKHLFSPTKNLRSGEDKSIISTPLKRKKRRKKPIKLENDVPVPKQ